MSKIVSYTLSDDVSYDVFLPDNISSDTPIMVYSFPKTDSYETLKKSILNSGVNAVVIIPKPKYWLDYHVNYEVVSLMVEQVREQYSIQPSSYISNGFSQVAFTAMKMKVYEIQDNPDCERQLILLNDGVPLSDSSGVLSDMLSKKDIETLEQNNAFIIDYCQENKWQNVGSMILNSSLDILFISDKTLPYDGFWANHSYIFTNGYESGLFADVLSFVYDDGDLPEDQYIYRLYNHETKQLEEYTAVELKEKLNLTLEEFQQLHHGDQNGSYRITSFTSPICSQYSELGILPVLTITSGRTLSSDFSFVETSMNAIRKEVKKTTFLNGFQNLKLRSSSGIPGCISGYLNSYFDVVGHVLNSISLETESVISYAQAIVDYDQAMAEKAQNIGQILEVEDIPSETKSSISRSSSAIVTASVVPSSSVLNPSFVSIREVKPDYVYQFDGYEGLLYMDGNQIKEVKYRYSYDSSEEANRMLYEIQEKYKDCDFVKEIKVDGNYIDVIFKEEIFQDIDKDSFVREFFQDGKLVEEKQAVSATTSSVPYGSSTAWSVEPHSHVSTTERQRRIQLLGGEVGTPEQQIAKMKTIKVPYWDGSSVQEMNLTVNSAIVDNFQDAFQELADMHYTIIPSCTGVYNYRDGNTDHALGSALDINWQHNFYSGDGSEYSIRGREDVIAVFAKYGFYWGGDWSASKVDDMHFTFAGY